MEPQYIDDVEFFYLVLSPADLVVIILSSTESTEKRIFEWTTDI